MGASASQSYKLKSTTGKFNAARSKYNDELIEHIKKTNADLLYLFGYANHPNEENPTAFFNFENHDPEHLKKFYGFRKINEDSLKQVVKDGGWKGPKYQVNKEEVFDLYPTLELDKVQEPARLWAEKKLGYKTESV